MTRIVAACAAALFAPLLALLASGRVLTMDDLSSFHVPVRLLYARALASGDTVTWTPALASGFYLHGEGQVGMFHPLHLLLYSTLPFEAAFNLEIIGSYVCALAGMLVMLRRMGASPAASWFGAMAFAFSGFNLMRLVHVNAIAVGAHLPWLIVAAGHVMAASSRRARIAGVVGFAVTVGSMLLLGFPQGVFLCGVAVIVYGVWRGASAGWAGLAWLTAAFLCGLGIGAVQVLPMLDLTLISERGRSSVAFALTYSLHPMNLLQLVTPYVYTRRAFMLPNELSIHESVVYSGAFSTLAVCWAIVRWRDLQGRAVAAWALSLAAIAVVLALGRYAGVYYMLALLPVVGWFRGPARFVLLLHFALAIVSAIVFDDLLRIVRDRCPVPRRVFAGLAVPVILGALIAVAAVVATGRGPWRGAGSVALMSGTAILVALSARGHRIALALLPAFFALDLALWGYRYVWQETPASVSDIARHAEVPPGSPGELVHTTRKYNVPVLAGYRVANPYVALVPLRVLDPEDRITHRLAGVSWRLSAEGWNRVDAPMPRVRLLSDARVSTDIKRDIQTIDIERTVLLNEPVPAQIEAGPPGDARVVVDRPGRIVVQTRSDGTRMLVTTERYHSGWETLVDGNSMPSLRLNGDFLGCFVYRGTSTVTLTFAPPSLWLGKVITLVSAAVALALLAYAMWPRREWAE